MLMGTLIKKITVHSNTHVCGPGEHALHVRESVGV
jgi:hypothetical protein